MQESLGQKIRRLRKERKLSQSRFAACIGITQTQVCKYENDESIPSLTTLEWMCQFFEISASELLGF